MTNPDDRSSPTVTWTGELLAGVTTFFTMSYIVVVNPAILSQTGMPRSDVFFATCVASAVATCIMGLWAKYPFALAPGMGLNAFFAFTVCGQMGLSWPTALACVLVSGVFFLVLSLVGLREKAIAAVPPDLVRATTAGIGLFIAFIGLEHAGIVVDHPETLVTLGAIEEPAPLIAVGGLLITAALVAAQWPGAILIGIILTAGIAWTAGVAPPPDAVIALPRLPRETLGAAITGLGTLAQAAVLPAVFTMLFLDLFDTMGTLLALGYSTGHLDARGRLPRADKAFAADAVGTVTGALLGTSTVTTYIESASGIVAGGRTGRTALTVGVLFLLALPFYPLLSAIPGFATSPALIVVGALIFSGARDIDWKDPVVAIPCLGTMLLMPATFSIANGLGVGFILYAVTHLAARRAGNINPLVYIISGAFVLYFAVG